jgi:hypothetical protein
MHVSSGILTLDFRNPFSYKLAPSEVFVDAIHHEFSQAERLLILRFLQQLLQLV